MVQDLINQIVEKTGIPADKAQQVLGVIAGYVKEQFPMVGGQIDSVLETGGGKAGGDANSGGSNLMGNLGGKMGF